MGVHFDKYGESIANTLKPMHTCCDPVEIGNSGFSVASGASFCVSKDGGQNYDRDLTLYIAVYQLGGCLCIGGLWGHADGFKTLSYLCCHSHNQAATEAKPQLVGMTGIVGNRGSPRDFDPRRQTDILLCRLPLK